MSPQKTGFLISSIVHLGLLFTLFFTVAFKSPPSSHEQDVALTVSLDMFAPQPEPEPIPEVKEQDSTPEIIPIIPDPEMITSEILEEKIKPQPKSHSVPQSEPPPIKQLTHTDNIEEVLIQKETATTYLRLLEQQYSDALKQAIEANNSR